MTYQVLARKWRPQKFSELAGQEHIVRTLQNALQRERVAHAYLFVGPRGTGKTTTARIFAKALNCETGVVTEPCCQCLSCRQIAAGNSLDVIEIDGASNNSVADIRDLRENAQYTPSRGRFKIYIIDEIHMLSSSAWNALLKTLEEPPAHVKFFFATTEPHKVLATILSRCQRFDLKRLPAGLIAERLGRIAEAESVRIEDRALAAIARAADGGMRDGQSIFDQIISFCGDDSGRAINEEDVIRVFGIASGVELKRLVEAILADDTRMLIEVVQELAEQGRDLERVYIDLLVFVRNLLIVAVTDHPERLLDAGEAEISDLREAAADCEVWRIQRMLDKMADCESWLRGALNKRVYLEVILIKVMRHAHSLPIDQVIDRLNQLRKGLPPSPGPNTDVSAPETVEKRDFNNLQREGKAKDAENKKTPDEPEVGNTDKAVPPIAASTTSDEAPEKTSAEASGQRITNTPFDEPLVPSSSTAAAVRSTEKKNTGGESEVRPKQKAKSDDYLQTTAVNDEIRESTEKREKQEPRKPEDEEKTSENEDISQCIVLWRGLIEEAGRETGRLDLKNSMRRMRPVSFRGEALIVAYDDDFPPEQLKQVKAPEAISFLEHHLRLLSGCKEARLVIKRWDQQLSVERRRRLISSPEVRKKVEQDSFVRQVVSLFEGEIFDARG